jgi:transposase-like protein
MAVCDMVNLSGLLDEAKCFELVRQHRWPDGVRCPDCDSAVIIRNGHDEGQRHRQRYLCKACHGRFDDLTGIVLAGHHQPLRVWVLCLYLMGLNLSNRQIAQELSLDASEVQAMTEQLRQGLVARAPVVKLEGTAEVDEVYIVAGHKGQPREVKKGATGTAAQASRCAGTRHAGEGETASPWSDPARRSGDPAHAAQRAASDDQAAHHPGGGARHADPYR